MVNETPTIVVIDDRPDNLVTVRAFVTDAFPGATVLTAQTGAKGIALAREHRPDLILLDIVMPEMDGYEVCRFVKQDPELKYIPVIFLTAQKDDRMVRVKAIESGGEGFLSKPFDEAEFLAQIRAMVKIKASNEREHDEKRYLSTLVAQRTRQLEKELVERRKAEYDLKQANLELARSKTALVNALEHLTAQRDSETKMLVALRASEERYRALFNEMLEGFAVHQIICDETGTPTDYRFLSVNPAFERMTGWKAEEVVGRTVLEVMPNLERRWIDIYGKVALTGEPSCFEQHAHEMEKDFEVMAFRPSPGQFACIFQDITERKRLQVAVEKRIIALTRPLGNDSEVSFEELFDLKEIQRIQNEFASSANVASLITSVDGTPITQPSGFTRLCRDFIRTSEKGCMNCRRSDVTLGRFHPDGPTIQPCLSGGLWDASVNIIVGGRHIANWLIGQVRDETQSEDKIRAYARELGLDETAFMTAFHEVPVMPQAQFRKIAQTLFTFANQLSTQAYMNMQQARLIADEKRHVEELRRLSTAIEQSCEQIVITDAEARIQYVNPAFVMTTGYTREEALGQNPRILKAGQQDATFYQELWRTIASGRTWNGRFINKRKDGTLFTEEAAISPVWDASGRIVNYVAVKRDISEHLRLSEQLQQAQKMDSIGRLAGGVAHDFNNMLQAIIGTAELAMEDLDPSNPHYADFSEICKVGRRSADLTRQLLAFARRQTIVPVVLDLNQTVEGMLKMLRRLIGEAIHIDWRPQADLGGVKLDPSQMDQVLTNLCLNARDAMAGVGEIVIETGHVSFDETFCAHHPDLAPGDYLRLTVKDHGCGMDAETLAHVFEPFYTTKGFGRGTGLGLSMVYGIIKQNKGHIDVHSVPGHGTTFDIYLPKDNHVATSRTDDPAKDMPVAAGDEVILLTEDEQPVLAICKRYLEESGYTVLAVENPEKALHLAHAYSGKIHLLLSDMVMPNMSGIELRDQLIQFRPNVRTLFMTGYTTYDFAQQQTSENECMVLTKPFAKKDLLIAVRKVLDHPSDEQP